MAKSIQEVLDGDVPPEVPHWFVEFSWDCDEPNLTPIEAVERALLSLAISGGPFLVSHTRSGLMWFVNMERREAIEVEKVKPNG